MVSPTSACATWVYISSVRLGMRSASDPAYGASTAIGRNCSPVTMPSAVEELFVRMVRTSQSWATRAIQVPTFEIRPPVQKSR